ncbi:tRNA uridine-5-carboxymethylaminomethyl(34) synthesis GTPase MnmE [candidate division FCPU426 bacterium]|nr:tRNA uridine-5-carboxymethylaminomethyl(34) synthesis GTPase MnmE [candidate division FCPU426 bacterium]
MHKRSDTIAALSTPLGRSGIGIIRISGPQALKVVSKFISSDLDILSLTPHHKRKMIHAYVWHEKQKLDEILLTYMPAKKAYTGETTVELNCHGGRAILAAVLELALEHGARLAEPGEFTRRAFQNGRVDLIKAEAVNELIHAHTKKAVKAAWRQMEGGLSSLCTTLRHTMKTLIMEMQAEIDFEIPHSIEKWKQEIKSMEKILEKMLQGAEKRRYFMEGCWIVIAGPTNAGKSSLFNCIVNMERSIVSDLPGTTRDHISETIELEGVEVRITDTAGVRETRDKIETISIERTKQQIHAADIIVYVIDQSSVMSKNMETEVEKVIQENGIIVFNKADLARDASVQVFINKASSGDFVFLSILTNYGVDVFMDRLAEKINEKTTGDNSVITNIRQTRLLESAKTNLKRAAEEMPLKLDASMYEIEEATKNISEIIGDISNEEILDAIFSKFCIGK